MGGSCWKPGAGSGRLHRCQRALVLHAYLAGNAYTCSVVVAFRADDLLIFRACSRTLDLASSMDEPELATVERARTSVMGEEVREAADTRIVE